MNDAAPCEDDEEDFERKPHWLRGKKRMNHGAPAVQHFSAAKRERNKRRRQAIKKARRMQA